MAEFQKLDNELVIASIQSKTTSIFLTNFRVFKHSNEGGNHNSSIIPIDNIDSFGLIKTERNWLLYLGTFIFLLGLTLLAAVDNKAPAVGAVIVGAFFYMCWSLFRKTGIAIYSLSGKTEIFLEATGDNQGELLSFVNSIQSWLFLQKTTSNQNPAPQPSDVTALS